MKERNEQHNQTAVKEPPTSTEVGASEVDVRLFPSIMRDELGGVMRERCFRSVMGSREEEKEEEEEEEDVVTAAAAAGEAAAAVVVVVEEEEEEECGGGEGGGGEGGYITASEKSLSDVQEEEDEVELDSSLGGIVCDE